MAEDYGYVAPVDHGVLSATGNVAAGTVGGALKAVGKTALWCIGGGAVLGSLALMGWLPLVAIVSSGAASAAWGTLGNLFGGAVLGGFLGGLASLVVSPVAAAIGAGKGAIKSSERVSMEKGQARAMDMQMAAYQSMAAAENNKYAFTPAPGTAKNMAMPQIDASSADRAGMIAGRSLGLAQG